MDTLRIEPSALSACEADVIPLHHVPLTGYSRRNAYKQLPRLLRHRIASGAVGASLEPARPSGYQLHPLSN